MDYESLYSAVEDVIKIPGGSKRGIAKHIVNMTYMEIVQADDQYPMYWLRKHDDTLGVVTPGEITDISQASPAVVTDPAHGLSSDYLVSLYNIAGMTELNNRMFRITVLTADTYSLQDLAGTDIDSTGYTAYTSGGDVLHRGLLLNSIDKILLANLFNDNTHYDPLKMVPAFDFEGDTRVGNRLWSENSGRPEYAIHHVETLDSGTENHFLILGPGADDNYQMRLWKTVKPALLSADTDVPLLPENFHYGIVAGSVMKLNESNVQVENAVVWPGIYQATVSQLLAYNRAWYKQHENQKPPFMI